MPFSYQIGTVKRSFPTFESCYRSIIRHKRPVPDLVQQGIDLLKHRNHRFDIRVMVQRNQDNRLEVTGIIGRLGEPGKIVTPRRL